MCITLFSVDVSHINPTDSIEFRKHYAGHMVLL